MWPNKRLQKLAVFILAGKIFGYMLDGVLWLQQGKNVAADRNRILNILHEISYPSSKRCLHIGRVPTLPRKWMHFLLSIN